MNTLICRRVILVAFWMGVAGSGVAQAELLSLKVPLTGASCVPPVETNGTGTAELTYDAATQVVTWRIVYSGLSSPATMAHFHGPAAQDKKGPVVIWLAPQGSSPENPITGQATLTPEQAQQFVAGEWYVNVHTQSRPACELRGQVMHP